MVSLKPGLYCSTSAVLADSHPEMVGTIRYQERPPSSVAAATTTALKPNITRGFARIERKAPSKISPRLSGRSGTIPRCTGGGYLPPGCPYWGWPYWGWPYCGWPYWGPGYG